MNQCVRLSDRIPEVALGRSSWAAEEEAHLRDCPECRAEWALVRAAGALGAGAPVPADPAIIAVALLRRLTDHRARARRRAWSLVGLAAAAAVALAVWTGTPGRPAGGMPVAVEPPAGETLVPLPELEALEPAELDSLLERMEAPLAGGSTLDAPTLGELGDHELERVLATWEG